MWRLYAQSGGLAICSTYNALLTAVNHYSGPVHAGVVKYGTEDLWRFGFTNVFHFLMLKRRSFEHEKEVRAIIWRSDAADVEIRSVTSSHTGARGSTFPYLWVCL